MGGSLLTQKKTEARMTNHPDYEGLPEGIKATLTQTEYNWLGDEERGRLMERETQPDMDVIE